MGATKTSYGTFSESLLLTYATYDLGILANVTLLTGTNYNDTIDLTTDISTKLFVIAAGNGDDKITGSARGDVIWGDSAGNTNSNDNGSDTLLGGKGNDEIHGGNGKDYLDGGDDNDFLYGDNGVDTILGGAGADRITGGNGGDVLTGGTGADRFIYRSVIDSPATSSGTWTTAADVITDFKNSENDKLDLAALNSQLSGPSSVTKLTWSDGGVAAAHGVWTDGTYVYADTTGDTTADLVIKVSGVTGTSFVGVNHGPTVAGPLTGDATEDAPASAFNLLAGASDSDSDALSLSGVTYSVDGGGTSATAPTGVSLSGSTLTVDTTNDVFDALGANETLTITVNYDIKDIYNAKVHQTETITVHGVNDAVVITDAFVKTGDVSEGDDDAAARTTAGAIAYTDADVHDNHSITVLHDGTLGNATIVGNAWHYTVRDEGAVNALGVDETTTDTFTVQIDDDHGSAVSQDVTVTIHGTNDAVVITDAFITTGDVSEGDDDAAARTTTGAIAYTDADVHDNHSITVLHDGTLGNATIVGGEWQYTVRDEGAVNALGVGEMTTDTFTIQIDDGNGSIVSQDVTVTIHGTNDAPHLTSGDQTGSVTEDATTVALGQVMATDPDTHDVLQYTTSATSAYGSFTVDVNTGAWKFQLANSSPAVQGLGSNDHIQETFTVDVSDGNGGVIHQNVVVTINGADDATGIPPPVTGTVFDTGDNSTDQHDQTQPDGTPPTGTPTSTGGNVDGTTQGTDGNNTLSATGNDDTAIYGKAGNDTLTGRAGADALYGGTGDDILFGGSDTDHLYGGSGSDILHGGPQDDVLIGGFGADYINGDEASDTFVFESIADRGDFIDNFSRTNGQGPDRIDVSALGITHLASGAADNAIWDYGVGSTVVQGVTYTGELYAADTDGNHNTIEFWFVVGGTGLSVLQDTDFIFA